MYYLSATMWQFKAALTGATVIGVCTPAVAFIGAVAATLVVSPDVRSSNGLVKELTNS